MIISIDRKKERRLKVGIFLLFLFLIIGVGGACLTSGWLSAFLVSVMILCGYIYLSTRFMINHNRGIPVLTFHSVSGYKSKVVSEYLTLSVQDFSNMLHLLDRKGYRCVGLEDVQAHMEGSHILEGKVFAITFDDGYLDNWVYAFPVMKKLGFSGTLFVATDFIEETSTIHPQIECFSENISLRGEVTADGYLSSAELREIEGSGVFNVESHLVTHTWLYNSDTVSDFVQPDDPKMMWLLWNFDSKGKSQWFKNFEAKQKVLLGHPVFNFSRSHVTKKAYYPDNQLLEGMQEFIIEVGGIDFFTNSEWRRDLNSVYQKLISTYPGRWEESDEAAQRLNSELCDSKNYIERLLSKKVRYLCWPGDVYTKSLLQKALTSYGYKGATGGIGRNSIGENPSLISRIFVKYRYVPFHSFYLNKLLFYTELKVFEGNYYYYIISLVFNQFNKLLNLVHYRELKSKKAL